MKEAAALSFESAQPGDMFTRTGMCSFDMFEASSPGGGRQSI